MNFLIGQKIFAAPAMGVVFTHFPVQALQFGNLFVRNALCCKFADQGFVTFEHLEKFGGFLDGDPRNQRTPVGQQFDKLFGGENLERLAQRRA